MKLWFYTTAVAAGLMFGTGCGAQCPPSGAEPEASRMGRLNIAKNRDAAPPSRHKPVEVSLQDVVGEITEADSLRFHNGEYVSTSGYIIFFEERGPESCNCDEASKAAHTGDVHIFLGLTPDAAKSECMIVEITPSFKALHPGYADLLVKGRQVNVSGYMLYDFEHRGNAANTCTSCGRVWRKTCWEIHPVTDIR